MAWRKGASMATVSVTAEVYGAVVRQGRWGRMAAMARPSVVAAALREAQEEIGLAPEAVCRATPVGPSTNAA